MWLWNTELAQLSWAVAISVVYSDRTSFVFFIFLIRVLFRKMSIKAWVSGSFVVCSKASANGCQRQWRPGNVVGNFGNFPLLSVGKNEI